MVAALSRGTSRPFAVKAISLIVVLAGTTLARARATKTPTRRCQAPLVWCPWVVRRPVVRLGTRWVGRTNTAGGSGDAGGGGGPYRRPVGFSIRLAPGLRISASSRGLRASVGPRAARVHFGSGRPGLSTGFGPVGFYTSLGGGRGSRRGATSTYRGQIAAAQRETVHARRLELARTLADSFRKILSLHRTEFPPAQRPIAPRPQVPDWESIYRRYEQHALSGLNVFQRAKRAEAKRQAATWTEDRVQELWAAACDHYAQMQAYFDERWQALCDNDPAVVIETLEETFEDNEAPAAAVGVDGDNVALVVLVPAVGEAVPEQMPTTTQAGNLSLKKLPQRDRADYYRLFVCGQVLATVRESFAVAPGIRTASVAVLCNEGRDAYGKVRVSCIFAAAFDRTALDGVRWADADAARIVNDVSTDRLFEERGRSGTLSPIDLTAEPALARVVAAVDLEDLAA